MRAHLRNLPHLRKLSLVTLCISLGLCYGACRPIGADRPTRVESGLKYTTGHPEFDRFFDEFHTAQLLDQRSLDDERALRREAAKKLKLDEGATAQHLLDEVTKRARALAARKNLVTLEVEGLGADDETDTLVTARVSGELDAEARQFVEAATLFARKELRLAAGLRKAKKTYERLSLQAFALEPSVESYFDAQGYRTTEEVRRNLSAAKRNLPLMVLRANEQADNEEQLVQRIRAAMTTNPSVEDKEEPALITNGSQAQRSETKPARSMPSRSRAPAVTAPQKTKKAAPETESTDFAP